MGVTLTQRRAVWPSRCAGQQTCVKAVSKNTSDRQTLGKHMHELACLVSKKSRSLVPKSTVLVSLRCKGSKTHGLIYGKLRSFSSYDHMRIGTTVCHLILFSQVD
jgi:hypothetical protein